MFKKFVNNLKPHTSSAEDTVVVNNCRSIEDFQQLLQQSHQKPVLLFKHSNACPVSARARHKFKKFVATVKEIEVWQVLVIENRAISQHIARESGIHHQSPQVILFDNGRAVWDESHWSISEKSLQKALLQLT